MITIMIVRNVNDINIFLFDNVNIFSLYSRRYQL